MRLKCCEAHGGDRYIATIELDDGNTEFLYSPTIPGLRSLVLSRVQPVDNFILHVDELFERLLEREIMFTKNWLKVMNAKMSRAAA